MSIWSKVGNIATGGLSGAISGDGSVATNLFSGGLNSVITKDQIANALINPISNIKNDKIREALNKALYNPLGNIKGKIGQKIENVLINPYANKNPNAERWNKKLESGLVGTAFGTIGNLVGGPIVGGAMSGAGTSLVNGQSGMDSLKNVGIGAAMGGASSYITPAASSGIQSATGASPAVSNAIAQGATNAGLNAGAQYATTGHADPTSVAFSGAKGAIGGYYSGDPNSGLINNLASTGLNVLAMNIANNKQNNNNYRPNSFNSLLPTQQSLNLTPEQQKSVQQLSVNRPSWQQPITNAIANQGNTMYNMNPQQLATLQKLNAA